MLCGGFAEEFYVSNPDPYGAGGILAKMDEAGNFLWTRTYADELDDTEFHDIKQMPDSSIMIVGYHHRPYEIPALVKLSPDGDVIWWQQYIFNTEDQVNQALFDLIPTADHGFLMTGYAHPPLIPGIFNTADGWLLKVDSLGCPVPLCVPVTSTEEAATETPADIRVWPNPFRDELRLDISERLLGEPLRLRLFDLHGRLLLQREGRAGHLSSLETGVLPAGLYFLHLEAGGGRWVEKVVKGE